MDLRSDLSRVTDRAAWAQRGATFMTKLKATKVVWFPPKPEETGRKAASAAKRTTKKAAKKSRKTTSTATKATTGSD